MPQVINTNIASLTAQRNLNKSQTANQQALQRLSSGLRINSAKDDAAGLAISTRFNSQVRGLNVAIRNAGDGISLAQTAEGALGTMNDNLQRIRELAVQSANATNSDVDREALQAEVDQLLSEVTRTAEETDFNGRKLLDGSFNATFQIGANAGQTVEVSIAELTADKLGSGKEAGVSALGTDSAISNGDLVINGEGIRSSSATDDTASTSGADRSAIAKAAAINDKTATTGVAAEINTNVSAGTKQTATATDGSITLNGVNIEIATGGVDTSADRAAVLAAINAVSDQTGIVAIDSGNDEAGIALSAADGRNIEIRFDKFGADGNSYANQVTAAATGLADGGSGFTAGAIASSAEINGVATISAVTSLAGTFNLAIDGNEAIVVTATGTGVTLANMISSLQSSINTAISANGLDVTVTVTENDGVLSMVSGSIGENSSLVISAVVEGTGLDIGEFLGLGTTTAPADVLAALTAADIAGIYMSAQGSDGTQSSNATYEAAFGLAEASSGAMLGANLTMAEAAFSIEVDGGNAVAVTVALEGSPAVTVGDLDSYAEKVEAQINAALALDGQSGRVDVFIGEGYKINIQSLEEGSDSQIRILTTNSGATEVGILTQTLGRFATDGNVGVDGVENASETYEGSITLRSVNGEGIDITAGSGSLDSSGLQSGSYNAGQAYAASQSQSVAGAISSQGQVELERVSTSGFNDTIVTAMGAGTVSFDIEVDSGNAVSITVNFSVGSTELDDVDSYLSAVEAQINAGLSSDSQTGTVSVFLGEDNQVIIQSNSKGDGSKIEISGLVEADVANNVTRFGLRNNIVGVGASGAESTQGVITGAGEILADASSGLGTTFSAALAVEAGQIASEEIRISVDGGETITATIANMTVSDAAAGLAFVENEINDELADAGQAGRISLALNADGRVTMTSDKVGSGSSVEYVNGDLATAGTFTQLAGFYDYQVSTAAVEAVSTPDGLDSGDLILNGVAIETAKAADDTASNSAADSSSKQASGIAMAAAINNVSDQTGVTATVNTTSLVGGSQVATLPSDTPQSGSIVINGVETASITTNGANGGADDKSAAIAAINAITGQTGVSAVDDGEGITLQAADGRNISVVINNNDKAAKESSGAVDALTGAALGLNVAAADISGGDTFAATAQTTYSTVTLDGPGVIDIASGANGAAALEQLGLRVGEYGSSEAGTRLSDLDITTVAGAELAIKALDNAIGSVASQRANLGAIQNRLDSTVNNLSLTSINLQAANSRIQDADFAAETAELSRSQVLQQAGISILAQANAAPQQVLSLLG